ncbi:MAG: hypothetical protein K6G62_03655 [Eubacterium sp.]|nr:hypothetical protein [Eubacterium sp.]
MFITVYLTCFFIFMFWLTYEMHKSKKEAKEESDAFWAREDAANSARNKDISNLPLVKIQEDDLPIFETGDESVHYYVGRVREIIKMPMMDFSDYSNTDLKLAYGVGNFKTLSQYDETFHAFLLDLSNLARAYYTAGMKEAAIETYLFAIKEGSRRLSDFESLARIYLETDHPEKLSQLLSQVREMNLPHQESIEKTLQEVLLSYK